MSCSQAGQDLFVLKLIGTSGTYLDVGCGDCIDKDASNTLYLSQHNWTGLGIDINERFKWGWTHIRQQPMLVEDVCALNWNTVIQTYPFIENVDYLSFDVDDSTIPAVARFPWDRIRAKVITIEHDRYRVGEAARVYTRYMLMKFGYTLVCEDIKVDPHKDGNLVEYEDWWLDAKHFDKALIEKIRCKSTDGRLVSTFLES